MRIRLHESRAAGFSPRDRSRGPKPAARPVIRRKLMAWYDQHRRDLPWRRRADDPYAQWVAEIMLQQTRVETVLAYYEPFLRRFPTVQALARAKSKDVLKAWEGLGYYRRILNLHRAAGMVSKSGGGVPSSVDELRELPGIGDYTAAAIASIAFGRPEAAVDGNVGRVISRLAALQVSPTQPAGHGAVKALAETLLHPKRPGDFNQAWMDLGSMICTPRAPKCGACPLLSHCAAGQAGDAESYPRRDAEKRTVVRPMRLVVGVFHRDGRLLVRRRPEGGLWSGLWEFPSAENHGNGAARSLARRLADEVGVEITTGLRRAGQVRHELTHRSVRFDVWVAEGTQVGTLPKGYRWVTPAAWSRLAVSTALRKVYEAVTTSAKR